MSSKMPPNLTPDLGASLEAVWSAIEARRGASPEESYTAKLLSEGEAKCAQKLGEEAVETAIAAARRDREQVIRESADLLYHLLVLWAATGVAPRDVAAVLASRKGISGLVEKSQRNG